MNILKISLLIVLLSSAVACTSGPAAGVRTETRQTRAGSQYSIFYADKLEIQLVTSRPKPDTGRYQLSVAAAYTDLQTDQPLGLLVCQGRLLQAKPQGIFLDGALIITGNTLAINRIKPGQLLDSTLLVRTRSQQGTVLLQELLVYEGKNQKSAGGSVFQRRALVEFANQRFAVVEGMADDDTMQQFGAALIELGAKNALYLDMGDWDEGWYKAGSQVVVLGNRRTHTARQSNWLVFVQPH